MRPGVTVAEVIESRRVLRFWGWDGLVLSPDGSRYAFFVTQGDLAKNGNCVELWAGERTSLERSKPVRVLRLFTSALSDEHRGIHPVIHSTYNSIRWLDDNRHIAFLWTEGRQPTQVVRADVVSHQLDFLTSHPQSVTAYAIHGDGDIVVFDAVPALPPPTSAPGSFTVKTTDLLAGIFAGQFETAPLSFKRETWLVRADQPPVGMPVTDGFRTDNRRLNGFSPDGRYVLITEHPITRLDPAWNAYEDPTLRSMMEQFRIDPEGGWIQQSALIDLKKRELRALWPVPLSLYNRSSALWSPDGASVVVGPTYLPSGMHKSDSDRGNALAEVSVETGVVTVLPVSDGREPPRPVAWNADGTLVVKMGEQVVKLRKERRGWSQLDSIDPASEPSRVNVRIVQRFDLPPYIEASDAKSRAERNWGPIDPGLSRFTLGSVEMMSWNDTSGRTWQGRLYLPVRYRQGQRYPLVVQTHGFAARDQFSLLGIDDSYGSVFVAQPLAARSVAVLQVQDWGEEEKVNTPQEPQIHEAGFEGGIQALVERGLADLERVGISGFSRSGWYVEYALAFGDFPYAAAIAADNVGYGYFESVLAAAYGLFAPVFGEKPMGKGLKPWLESSVPFNAERIRAPLRLEALTGETFGLYAHWELYTRLREARLPVELFVVENSEGGAHPLQNSHQRLSEQQGVVDWFDFWLNGREEPDSAKQVQYAQWRALREQQQRAESQPRPPLLRWESKERIQP